MISEVQEIIPRFVNAGKPIGAICFAPAVVAKTLSNVDITGVLMTMGSMEDGQLLEKWGCEVKSVMLKTLLLIWSSRFIPHQPT